MGEGGARARQIDRSLTEKKLLLVFCLVDTPNFFFPEEKRFSLHCVTLCGARRIFGKSNEDESKLTEFGDDRVFNDLRYTINNDKLEELGWKEVSGDVSLVSLMHACIARGRVLRRHACSGVAGASVLRPLAHRWGMYCPAHSKRV